MSELTKVRINDYNLLSGVFGSIRWKKTYGFPKLTAVERSHGFRRPDGTIMTTDYSVGVKITVYEEDPDLLIDGEQQVYFLAYTEGITINCRQVPDASDHYRLNYEVEGLIFSGTNRAIGVTIARDREWVVGSQVNSKSDLRFTYNASMSNSTVIPITNARLQPELVGGAIFKLEGGETDLKLSASRWCLHRTNQP